MGGLDLEFLDTDCIPPLELHQIKFEKRHSLKGAFPVHRDYLNFFDFDVTRKEGKKKFKKKDKRNSSTKLRNSNAPITLPLLFTSRRAHRIRLIQAKHWPAARSSDPHPSR